MNVREMHIELDQLLQNVAANRTRKFLRDEKDLAFNKVVERFVQSHLRPRKDGSGGFDIDQVGTDAIRPLLTAVDRPAYIDGPGRVVSYLPDDYKFLIRDSSSVKTLCGVSLPNTTVPLTILKLKQKYSVKIEPTYYNTVSVSLGDSSVVIPGDLPYTNQYEGYKAKGDVYNLVPFILSKLRKSNFDVYWERFDNIYEPSTYIMVGIGVPDIASLVLGGETVTEKSIKTIYKERAFEGTRIRANRLTSSEKIQELEDSPFHKSSPVSPVSELMGNNLYTYTDDNFIVSTTPIVYVRKPQVISLHLGTDCDLDEAFHSTICDLTAEYLRGTVGDQAGQQLKESDIERRVTL